LPKSPDGFSQLGAIRMRYDFLLKLADGNIGREEQEKPSNLAWPSVEGNDWRDTGTRFNGC